MSGIDTSIYRNVPTQPSVNLLEGMAQALQLKGARAQIEAQQAAQKAKMALGPLAQQSIDPDTGSIDYGKFAKLVSTNPDTAYLAPDIISNIANKNKLEADTIATQLGNAAKLHELTANALTPLLDRGSDVSRSDVVKAASGLLGELKAVGLDSPEVRDNLINSLAAMPEKGPALQQYLTEANLGQLGAKERLEKVLGSISNVDVGGRVQPVRTNEITGEVTPLGEGFAKSMSPSEAANAGIARERLEFDKGKGTPLNQKVDTLVESGIPKNIAQKIAAGAYATSVNPQTGNTQVIDLATGKPVHEAEGQIEVPPVEPYVPEDVKPGEAVGASGLVKGALNTITDAIGQGMLFPEANKAAEAFNALQQDTIATLQEALPGRPSNLAMQLSGKLTVTPNSLLQGSETARTRLETTRKMLQQESNRIKRDILAKALSFKPDVLQEAKDQVSKLDTLTDQYEIMLKGFKNTGSGSGEKGEAPPLESFFKK